MMRESVFRTRWFITSLCALPLCPVVLDAQQPPRWTLVEELRIGREDDSRYALTATRDLAVAEDGAMFLGQPQANEIRVFDANGRFARSIGRRGEGPGEFSTRDMTLGLRGDTLWATDRNRVNLFRRSGEVLRTFVVDYKTGRPDYHPSGVRAILSDGTLAAGLAFASNPNPEAWPSGLPVLRIDRNGSVRDTLGLLDLAAVGFYRWEGRFWPAQRPFYLPSPHAYTPQGNALVYVRQTAAERAQPARFKVFKVNAAGDTVVAREITYQPIAVSTQVRDSIRDATLRTPLPRARNEAILKAAPVPAFYPPINRLAASADGSTWLHLQGSGGEWLVISPAGDVQARVRAPAALRILFATAERIWGVEYDKLDVPSLVRYRINRSSRD
jgi:hypothetical protein